MSQVFSALTRSERLLPVEGFDILEKTTAYRTLFLSRESNGSLYNRVSLYWEHYGQREQKQRFYRRVISSTRVPVRMCRFAGMFNRLTQDLCSSENEQTELRQETTKVEQKLESRKERRQSENEQKEREFNMVAHFMRISIPHNISTRYFVKLLAPYEQLLCPNLLCSPLLPPTVIFNQSTLSSMRECSFTYFASNALCSLITEIAELATKFAVPLSEAMLFVSCSLLYFEVMASKFLNSQNDTCTIESNVVSAKIKSNQQSAKDTTSIFTNTTLVNIFLTKKNFVEKLKEHTQYLINLTELSYQDSNVHVKEKLHVRSSEPCNRQHGKNDCDNKLRDKYHVVLRLYELALKEWQQRHEVLDIQQDLIQRSRANSQNLTPSTSSLVKIKNVIDCEESRPCMTIAYAPRDLPVKVWEDAEMPEHHSHPNHGTQAESELCATSTTNDMELATKENTNGESNEPEFFIPFESRDTSMTKHMFHLPRLPEDPAQLLVVHTWESLFMECVRDKAKVYTFREVLVEHVKTWEVTKTVCLEQNNSDTNVKELQQQRDELYSLQQWQEQKLECASQNEEKQEQQQQEWEQEWEQKASSKLLSHEIASCENGHGMLNCNRIWHECFFSIHVPSCLLPAHESWIANNTCGINWCGYKNVLHCFHLCTNDTHPSYERAQEATILVPEERTIAFDDYSLQLTQKSLFCTLEELADWVMRLGLSLSRLPVNAQARQMFVFTRSQMMYIMYVLKNTHSKLYMQCYQAGLHEMRLRISLNGFLLTYIRDDGVETKLTTLSELLLPVFAKLTKTLSVSRLRHALTRYWLHRRVKEAKQEALECDKPIDSVNCVNNKKGSNEHPLKGNVRSSNEIDNISRELPNVLSAIMNSGYDALEMYLLSIMTLRQHTICQKLFFLHHEYSNDDSNCKSDDSVSNKNGDCGKDEVQCKSKQYQEQELRQQHEEKQREESCNQLEEGSVETMKSSTKECKSIANKAIEFEVIELTPKEQKVMTHVLRSHPHIIYITGCGIHDIMLCTPSHRNRENIFNEEVIPLLTSSRTITRVGWASRHRTGLQRNSQQVQQNNRSVNENEFVPLLLVLVVRTCGTFVQVDVSSCYQGRWLHELASPVLVMPSSNCNMMNNSHRSLPLPANVPDADNRTLFDNVQDMLWYYFDSLRVMPSLSSCSSIESINDKNDFFTSSKSSEQNEQQKRLLIAKTAMYPTDKAVALYVIRHHPEYYSHIRGCGIAEVYVAYKEHKENDQGHSFSSIHQSKRIHLHKHRMQMSDDIQDLKNNCKKQPTFLIKRVCGTCVEVDFTRCYDTATTPYTLRPHQVICKQANVHKSAIDKPNNVQKRNRCEQNTKNMHTHQDKKKEHLLTSLTTFATEFLQKKEEIIAINQYHYNGTVHYSPPHKQHEFF